jgi:hypothetical protein
MASEYDINQTRRLIPIIQSALHAEIYHGPQVQLCLRVYGQTETTPYISTGVE